MLYESDNFHIMKVSAKYAPDLFPFSEKDMPDEFTAKGSFSAPNYEGQEIELGGNWRFDAKYKEHIFNAQYVVAVLPTTEQGTLKFLQSIEGIGKKMSARICSVLNGDIRNLVLDEDWLLANIKGMNRSRADKVCNAIRRANATAELTKALRGAVTGEIIQKVVVKYGSNALDVINSTPYRMVYDHTLPFKDADTIAPVSYTHLAAAESRPEPNNHRIKRESCAIKQHAVRAFFVHIFSKRKRRIIMKIKFAIQYQDAQNNSQTREIPLALLAKLAGLDHCGALGAQLIVERGDESLVASTYQSHDFPSITVDGKKGDSLLWQMCIRDRLSRKRLPSWMWNGPAPTQAS